MNFNDNNQPYSNDPGSSYPQPPAGPGPVRRPGSNPMAAASMVMAICSFLFMMSMGSIFFGCLGILFALLSRGSERLSGTAKAGLWGSVAGLIIGTAVYGFLFFKVFDSNLLEPYEEFYQEYLEEDPEELPSDNGNIL